MTDSNCVFCRIAAGDVPADVVWRAHGAVAFRDRAPVAPTHVLVVPEAHVDGAADVAAWLPILALRATAVAAQLGLASFRLVVNQGPDAGQQVPHLHVHVLGGAPLGAIG